MPGFGLGLLTGLVAAPLGALFALAFGGGVVAVALTVGALVAGSVAMTLPPFGVERVVGFACGLAVAAAVLWPVVTILREIASL